MASLLVFASCAALSPSVLLSSTWFLATEQDFSGGVKGSPSGTIFNIEICAPVSYREFKAGNLNLGGKCYSTSVRPKSMGKPLEVFGRGDTIILSVSVMRDGLNKTPFTECKNTLKKEHQANLTWYEKGREVVLPISAFQKLPALRRP